MNKRHWNTVVVDGSLPDETVRDMVQDSYDLVARALPQT
jgi:predicted DNA-binding protein (MmcQ/YjbR family)